MLVFAGVIDLSIYIIEWILTRQTYKVSPLLDHPFLLPDIVLDSRSIYFLHETRTFNIRGLAMRLWILSGHRRTISASKNGEKQEAKQKAAIL